MLQVFTDAPFPVSVFVAAVSAAPLGYDLRPPSGPYFHNVFCAHGQVRHVDGRCITPQVYTRAFLYDAPRRFNYFRRPHYIPQPKVERNVVFVRLPEDDQGPDPIIVPPPQQQQVVYVLNKQTEQDQRVIEVPAPPPTEPEVVFVNYEDGENPILPSGEDLHSALTTASHGVGHTVESGGIGGGISGIGSGIGHSTGHSFAQNAGPDFGGIDIKTHNLPTSDYSAPTSPHSTHTNYHSTHTSHFSSPVSHYTTPRSQYSTLATHYSTPSSQYSTPGSHYTTHSNLYTTP
ncbi:uncharacterized protein LOC119587214 [Penaeus monodon]|uniref:uncharacterized protein LOC119587214 n=1 Tax=Penaeus monodon TaxID=6687 RepID=UPI0018A6F20D|nr:uncharacterized protein LOC119587214 [Penaeus monodon]